MKKRMLIMVAPFAFLTASLAQITRTASDAIVLERLQSETRKHIVYAEKEVQTEEFTITTSMNEVLQLDYPCWVYYVNYIEETNNNHYLVVKESSGSLLEVRTKNSTEPDLATWRTVKLIEVPFT